MSATQSHPIVFISYSWSGPVHEEFVMQVATRLRTDGVDVRLDKWDLKEGHDKYAFMESMVTDANVTRVLVFSDKKYAEKADARSGGVGTESQIISQNLYGKVKQAKFIPIVCERDEMGESYLPVFMKQLMYVDFSSDERYAIEYERLLRIVYDRPLLQKPDLGTMPPHLDEAAGPSAVLSASSFRRAVQSLEQGGRAANANENIFYRDVAEGIRLLARASEVRKADDPTYAAIDLSKPYRDQIAEFLEQKAATVADEESEFKRHFAFLQELLDLCGPDESRTSWSELEFDGPRFIVQECFLITMAILISKDLVNVASTLLEEIWLLPRRGEREAVDYRALDSYIRSLDEMRNARLKANRVSITADLIKERATQQTPSFDHIMQADFCLCLRSVLGSPTDDGWGLFWFPRSLIYAEGRGPFPIFLKGRNAKSGQRLARLLGQPSLSAVVEKFLIARNAGVTAKFRWSSTWSRVNFEQLMDFEGLSKHTKGS